MVAIFSVLVSIVAAGIAVWASFESHRANTRADAANRLAEQANTLAKESNDHAAKANTISSQALELAERNAPAPLSELTEVDKDKHKWAFKNNSGREIELLSISALPAEAERLVKKVKPLPQILENGDQVALVIQGVWGLNVEALIIEWRFVGEVDSQQTRRNLS